ncbi:methyltransferase FkbM family protein (plasmid) [Leptolyngbya boryana NIES-2135]|jgi:FkbM family methyltransferase|uniref:Methyltransferase FkbM family protein n=1 Tax=Leptolyngbya boryana NIES-2135 TaxID=1973484 RepID=A0A1Z4JR34_LEPBY|nr:MULTISPECIES: FkbM family methyltransferase [Leptolyngbya]BAY59221.1 methyltransferase FkbM family protein [Leptolyngbya boryana NIES-2135]MBD2372810.1 FkbM family methyltransferase [Leptolyngbya sp. FACHB-238]MBD2397438.1 FkbM family methyltransferase [Leptolyngbya sp. FACHB-239]MBD2403757.1 FkbM family methyltransferase [Leptolyngbya sp. FACHB-402]ULP33414.1 FkbM family methyltransferase [Leptolyngbya boryana IU 594]
MGISETKLPNGMRVYYLREAEVPVLYEQVQEYLRYGIELNPGDTLFDVGANIGLFSLWAYERCQRNLQIYAFEPIPEVFEALKLNAQRLAPATMKAFSFGLAQERKSVVFDYYPNATALSTAYPEGNQTRATVEQAIKTALANPDPREPFDIWLLRLFPSFIRSLLINYKLDELFQAKPVYCKMHRLSDVIRDHSVQQIDLLKIDVERSELDVLMGIEPQDWCKIKQITIEVHDHSQRVDRVCELLKSHGFSKITIKQDPLLQGSDIFNLYAIR